MLISPAMATTRTPQIGFQPYVLPTQSPAEFTAKAIVIGVLFGLIFGASTVYLGLRAGLTVSASIPIAVLAISLLKRLGGGALWKSFSGIFQLFRTTVGHSMSRASFFPNATLNVDISPEYMGVGYVIGPRIAGVMFAGGVLSWMVLLPLLSILGNYMPGPLPPVPASGLRISEMSAQQLWSAYIRYTGAGAVLAAGIITLARTIPTIISSFRESVKDFGAGHTQASRIRTERDIPLTLVLGGSLLLAVFLAVAPNLPTQGNFLASILIVVFGFFFVTVSSRITGLIGASSNPISGMTIATLILTCTIFVALGWTGDFYAPIAISVGAVVCIAAANAGATSQDLKTGYIVGATPVYQQTGLLIGVVTSSFVIGMTTLYLNKVIGIGSPSLPAPQATLMGTIINGLLSQNLPWGLVLVGIFISVTLELCGIQSLSFAVGSYLPISTTAPIFVGGLVRYWVERSTGMSQESEVSAGTLFSSGLIAGGSICGILFAVLVGTNTIAPFQAIGNALPFLHGENALGQLFGALLFLALAVIVARMGMRKVE